MTEPGTLSHGTGGALQISVDAEKYRIEAEDLKNLLFYGRVIPITQDRSRTTPGGILASEKRLAAGCDGRNVRSLSTEGAGQELEKPGGFRVVIEGHAAMNASGKAVMLHTRVGSYIIPLVSFQRVARGEAISAPLFPLVPGVTG